MFYFFKFISNFFLIEYLCDFEKRDDFIDTLLARHYGNIEGGGVPDDKSGPRWSLTVLTKWPTNTGNVVLRAPTIYGHKAVHHTCRARESLIHVLTFFSCVFPTALGRSLAHRGLQKFGRTRGQLDLQSEPRALLWRRYLVATVRVEVGAPNRHVFAAARGGRRRARANDEAVAAALVLHLRARSNRREI